MLKGSLQSLMHRFTKLPRRQLVLGSVGIGLLLFAAFGLWPWYAATHSPDPLPDGRKTVTHSMDKPSETPVSSTAPYRVARDQPRSISLPDIAAEGFVQKVGIDQHGAVAVPGNVSMAGWYTHGAKPGDPGVSLIDGHAQGRYTAGIFKRLQDMRPGGSLRVTFGDDSVRSFTVVSVASYDTTEAAKRMLQPVKGITAQLNLITCDGRYDKSTQQYDKRVLVIAKLSQQ